MFVDELTPFVRELAHQPIAFAGGFFSGLFQLDLTEDPVKSWLNKQGADPFTAADAEKTASKSSSNGSKGSQSSKGPQSIDIE